MQGSDPKHAPPVEAPSALDLIDRLMSEWKHVSETLILTGFAPGIVDESFQPLAAELPIVEELRRLLRPEELAQLPELMRARRAGELTEIASDRERVAEAMSAQRRRDAERAKAERVESERRERQLAVEREEQQRREAAARDAERLEAKRLARQRAEEHARQLRQDALLARIQSSLETEFLIAPQLYRSDPDSGLITADEFERLRTNFVQTWAKRVLNEDLDEEQALAVASIGGNVQVVARAGSGKTRTLITRAAFLQRHCGFESTSLLCLAFNRDAADEMKTRLSAKGGDIPHVVTFHALAYALVHPDETLISDDASAKQFDLSVETQEVVDNLIRSDEYSTPIRTVMLSHFREDWERIVEGDFQLPMEEFLTRRRDLQRQSLKGHYVKSFGEKIIANALFEHDVDYGYEWTHHWGEGNYRPDFTIKTGDKSGIIIEYFGMAGDPSYDESSEQKRQLWKARPGWTLLELYPEQIKRNGPAGFVALLLKRLKDLGVDARRLDEEEIWTRVRKRAVGQFATAMTNFIGRCRKRNLDPDGLALLVAGHTPASSAERLFLEVAIPIYAGYLSRLAELGKEDFDGLMWQAIDRVRRGTTRFHRDGGKEQGDLAQIRFLMIDEFQDFSDMFSELVNAIRTHSRQTELFCVGDDWQAINGFAGSDLRFFTNFADVYPDATTRHVRTNYRSNRAIVAASNALMTALGVASRAHSEVEGAVRVAALNEFNPSPRERSAHGYDELTPAVLRLVTDFLRHERDVVLLSRSNSLPWDLSSRPKGDPSSELDGFLKHLRRFLPVDDRSRVTISTTHKYKGREAEAVILLDAIKSRYPLIHPNWVFHRVFGDNIHNIEQEERRLFYVALTRAKHDLVLLTEDGRQSPYLETIRRRAQLSDISWVSVPPAPSPDGPQIVIRVFDAFDVKDELKNQKYRFEGKAKCWHKAVPEEGFSIDALKGQAWLRPGVRVEVYSENDELLFTVSSGGAAGDTA